MFNRSTVEYYELVLKLKHYMRDLCDVILSHCLWSCDVGKI